MKVGDSIRIAKHRLTHVYDGHEGKVTIVEKDPVTGHEYLFGTWGGISVCLEEGDEIEAVDEKVDWLTKRLHFEKGRYSLDSRYCESGGFKTEITRGDSMIMSIRTPDHVDESLFDKLVEYFDGKETEKRTRLTIDDLFLISEAIEKYYKEIIANDGDVDLAKAEYGATLKKVEAIMAEHDEVERNMRK